jgi:ribosome modulation factor
MEKRRKKKTPEERAAERAYQEDLDRRVVEMIERYRKLNAEKHAAEGHS